MAPAARGRGGRAAASKSKATLDDSVEEIPVTRKPSPDPVTDDSFVDLDADSAVTVDSGKTTTRTRSKSNTVSAALEVQLQKEAPPEQASAKQLPAKGPIVPTPKPAEKSVESVMMELPVAAASSKKPQTRLATEKKDDEKSVESEEVALPIAAVAASTKKPPAKKPPKTKAKKGPAAKKAKGGRKKKAGSDSEDDVDHDYMESARSTTKKAKVTTTDADGVLKEVKTITFPPGGIRLGLSRNSRPTNPLHPGAGHGRRLTHSRTPPSRSDQN
ncbi:hypothetical protein BV898_10741 [Hypsibius exemplaris]|uniref:Uncharacterized protein n=1 Tax=Hypsibius exemplaris TaxID=2072580 RepID=A0A1W0WIR6_HYPEX|nr:hypothetical protein BV898_10741 [Hypsibius exemplaris]